MRLYYILLALRFFHFMGLASLMGGLLTQMKESVKKINPAIRHGAYTQLVTGLAMVALREPFVNHAKVGLKLLILVVITGLIFKFRNKELPKSIYLTLLALSVLEVLVAVFL